MTDGKDFVERLRAQLLVAADRQLVRRSRRRRALAIAGTFGAAVALIAIVVVSSRGSDHLIVTGEATTLVTPHATTTATASSAPLLPSTSAVASSTNARSLHVGEIPSPNGNKPVAVFGIGDQFVAFEDATLVPVSDTNHVTKAWELVPGGQWHPITLPGALLHAGIQTVQLMAGRVVIVATTPGADPGYVTTTMLSGPSVDSVTIDPASADLAHPPAHIEPSPPPGHGIAVTGSVDSFAIGPSGLVATGFVMAGLNTDLLPQATQKIIRQHSGYVAIKDGHVIVEDLANTQTFFDQEAASLGLTTDEIAYLAKAADAHMNYAVWTATTDGRLQQSAATGLLPISSRYGNLQVTALTNGFVVTPSSTTNPLWWSQDGITWQTLTPPSASPCTDPVLLELGDRWFIHTPDGVTTSTDHGHTWQPVNFSELLQPGTHCPLLNGTQTFGILGVEDPSPTWTAVASGGALLYSPDGNQWSALPLDEAAGFAVAAPRLALASTAALIAAGDRAQPPGPDNPTRLVLITH